MPHRLACIHRRGAALPAARPDIICSRQGFLTLRQRGGEPLCPGPQQRTNESTTFDTQGRSRALLIGRCHGTACCRNAARSTVWVPKLIVSPFPSVRTEISSRVSLKACCLATCGFQPLWLVCLMHARCTSCVLGCRRQYIGIWKMCSVALVQEVQVSKPSQQLYGPAAAGFESGALAPNSTFDALMQLNAVSASGSTSYQCLRSASQACH